jgi:cytochrome P450
VIEVDEARLPELDVRSDAFRADPYGTITHGRERGPLARSHRGIEVLSFDVCAAIFASDRFATLGTGHFRAKGAPDVLVNFVEHGLLLNMTGDTHDRIRRVMSRAFSFRQIDKLRELMRDVARDLLEPVVQRGRCDLVAEFTEHYSMEVLCRFLGVPPADIPAFHRAAIDLHLMGAVPLAPHFPRLEEALLELFAFVHDLVELRKAEPRDDFISALIAAQAQDARLTDDEVVGNLVNLLFAGQDTTRFQLASAVRVFASVPGLWDRLATDPVLLPRALEEAMRLRPVSQFVVRQAEQPADAGGFVFPAGRRIILNLLAASRDPEVFAAADDFDLERDATYRLPFGWGVHYCLGQALARAEMCEALELLVRDTVCPDIGAVRDAPAAAMLGGPESLSLMFRRREVRA